MPNFHSLELKAQKNASNKNFQPSIFKQSNLLVNNFLVPFELHLGVQVVQLVDELQLGLLLVIKLHANLLPICRQLVYAALRRNHFCKIKFIVNLMNQ